MVRNTVFGIKVISRLIGLIYKNIAKMANKIVLNVLNHLKKYIQLFFLLEVGIVNLIEM